MDYSGPCPGLLEVLGYRRDSETLRDPEPVETALGGSLKRARTCTTDRASPPAARCVLLQLKDDSKSLQDTEPGGVAMSAKKRRRRNLSPEEKTAILRRHLADKVSVADLADGYHIQPSLLYQWQRQLLDNAARARESIQSPRWMQRGRDDLKQPPAGSTKGCNLPSTILSLL